MTTYSTARIPRQRDRLARDLDALSSNTLEAPSVALSAEDLVAEHNKGSFPDQHDMEILAETCSIPALALAFEHDGRSNPAVRNTIMPCGRHFEFARDASCEDGAQAAFTLLALGTCADVIDVVAFWPKPYVHLTLLGRVSVVGEDQVLRPHLSRGLRLHRTLLGYLAHRRRGIVILNPTRAALLLHGIRLIPEDDAHRDELRRELVAGPIVLEPGED